MMASFVPYGYAGLFLAAFLAATILPLSSEIVLTALLINGFDPVALVTVATCGNVLGAFTNYAIGFWGSLFLIRKILRMTEQEFDTARQRFAKYGTACLFFAWVPVIGDPLTVVAGALKINFTLFALLVTAGKLARYAVIAAAAAASL